MRQKLRHINSRVIYFGVLISMAFLFAGLAVAATESGKAPDTSLKGVRRASHAVWVAGDFNGDSRLDIVSLGHKETEGRDGRNELHIQFGALLLPESSVFLGGDRFRIRDLDGDSDRDIVLETALREPIAIWLNDGIGNFEEVDVESYRFQLSHNDDLSLFSLDPPSIPQNVATFPNRDAVSTRNPAFNLSNPIEILFANREESGLPSYPWVIRLRGPPALS